MPMKLDTDAVRAEPLALDAGLRPSRPRLDGGPPRELASFASALALLALASPASAQTHVVGWGERAFDSRWSGQTFAEIACGGSHVLARRGDGTLAAWGNNTAEQCNAPVLPARLTYVQITAGALESFALRSDGELVGWGEDNGQLDVPALPAGLTYVEVAAGGDPMTHGFDFTHVLARRSDGTVVAWGWGALGQCDVPALPAGLTYVEIAAGGFHSLARRSDGSLVAFGANDRGQCDVPALPPGSACIQLAAGYDHSLALLDDGKLVAWGNNYFGQCDVPALPGGTTYVEIAAGYHHNLARRSDGSVVSWGYTFGDDEVPALPRGVSYVAIAAGAPVSAGLRSDGLVEVWGGDGESWLPPPLPSGLSYVQVEGDWATLALRSDGAVVSFGNRLLADVPVLPAGLTYTEVAAGGGKCMALRSDGTLATWGGDGYFPPPPAGLTYVEIDAGGYSYSGGFSAARRSDGAIVGWPAYRSAPALPAGLTYVQFEVGDDHAVARRSDGAFVAWGSNSYGECDIPALPAGLSYVQLSPGSGHTLALRSDGTIVAFGSNGLGQCDVPALPPGLVYEEVSAGLHVSMARRSDGAIVGWGMVDWLAIHPAAIPPALAALNCFGLSSSSWRTVALYESDPLPAPDLVSLTPTLIEALIPGTEKTIAIGGRALELTTALFLDGAPVDFSRYTLESDALIRLDMPQLSSLGSHWLSVSDGSRTDSFPLVIVAPSGPRYQLGSGEPLGVVARDDGLSYLLGGPVGSVQRLYVSPSDVPSSNRFVSLDIGDHFTQLYTGGRYVIPAAGWLQVTIPATRLPDPGPAGLVFYSQTFEVAFPTPFEVGNPQSVTLVR